MWKSALSLMLKKVKKNPWIHTKCKWGLFWAKACTPFKYRGHPFSRFCVILHIMQQTKQQVDMG